VTILAIAPNTQQTYPYMQNVFLIFLMEILKEKILLKTLVKNFKNYLKIFDSEK